MLVDSKNTNDSEAKIVCEYVEEIVDGVMDVVNRSIGKYNSDERIHAGHFLDIMLTSLATIISKHIDTCIEVYSEINKPRTYEESKERCAEGLAHMIAHALYKSDVCENQDDMDEMCLLVAGHLATGETKVVTVE